MTQPEQMQAVAELRSRLSDDDPLAIRIDRAIAAGEELMDEPLPAPVGEYRESRTGHTLAELQEILDHLRAHNAAVHQYVVALEDRGRRSQSINAEYEELARIAAQRLLQ